MPETIPVNCSNCSKSTWSVAHVPGRTELKCSHCRSRTVVTIGKDGSVNAEKVGCFVATEINKRLNNGRKTISTIRYLVQLKQTIQDTKCEALESEYYRLSQLFVERLQHVSLTERKAILSGLEREYLAPLISEIQDGNILEAKKRAQSLLVRLAEKDTKSVRV